MKYSIKSKFKDERSLVFQNIFLRMVQEKCAQNNIRFHTSVLAKSDKHGSKFSTNHVTVCVYQERIDINHNTLNGLRSKRIPIQIASPDFDPDKLADKIIELSDELRTHETEMQHLLGNIFGDFRGA